MVINKGGRQCSCGKRGCFETYASIRAFRNKIAEVTWNLGGWNDAQIFSNEIYGYERGTTVYSGRSTTWPGRIALPYPSDYGYATDFNKCTQNLYNYYISFGYFVNRKSSLQDKKRGLTLSFSYKS